MSEQYLVEFWFCERKFEKYIIAEDYEAAKEKARNTPFLEILSSLTAKEVCDFMVYNKQKDYEG